MDTKLGFKKKLRMRGIMRMAWTLFKNGMISFSLSLKVSWQLSMGKITHTAVSKYIKTTRR